MDDVLVPVVLFIGVLAEVPAVAGLEPLVAREERLDLCVILGRLLLVLAEHLLDVEHRAGQGVQASS